MRKLTIAAVSALTLGFAGCSTVDRGAVIGGLGGAGVGALVAGDDSELEGALIGGAIGATAGALLGRSNDPNQCRYRGRGGAIYIADCPRGY